MTDPLGRPTSRLVSIDALRAVAAVAVVLNHVPQRRGSFGAFGNVLFLPLVMGSLGVPLFLAISGFCIHMAARRAVHPVTGHTDWAAFWKRRIVRLYPPYVAAIVLSMAIYYGTGGAHYFIPMNRIENPVTDVLVHLSMVHNLTQSYVVSLANGAFWSLGLEEQLYALYALYILLRRRVSAMHVAALALAIALVWRFCVVVPFVMDHWGPLGSWRTWPFSWWFAWIAGALVAEAYEGTTRLPRWCTSLPLAAALAGAGAFLYPTVIEYPPLASFYHSSEQRTTLFWYLQQLSELLFAVAFTIGMYRAVMWERRAKVIPWLVSAASKLGTISYSLYLVHLPLVAYLGFVLFPGDGLGWMLLRCALAVPLSILLAWIFFMAVERHFLNRRPKRAEAGHRSPTFVRGTAL